MLRHLSLHESNKCLQNGLIQRGPQKPYVIRLCKDHDIISYLICAQATDEMSDGQRLHAGFSIREAAKMVGVCRHTLMIYESGRTKVKAQVFEKLERLHQTLLSSRT